MSELVKVGRTMKSTFEQISEQGFLDQFYQMNMSSICLVKEIL